jgi:hypothetical protein
VSFYVCAQITTLRKVLDQQSEVVTALTKSEKTAVQNLHDSQRARDMLQLDKTHLHNELQAAETRATDRGRAADENAAKALQLEIKVLQLCVCTPISTHH